MPAEQLDVIEVAQSTFDDLRERMSRMGRCPAVLLRLDDGTDRPRLRIGGNTCLVVELPQAEQAKRAGLVLCHVRGNYRHGEDKVVSYYACGKSRADCMRRINAADATACKTSREMSEYGGSSWGTPMQGVKPEPGVWVQRTNFGPVERIA